MPLKELKGGRRYDATTSSYSSGDLCGVDVVTQGHRDDRWGGLRGRHRGCFWKGAARPHVRLWKKAVTRTLDWVDEDVK